MEKFAKDWKVKSLNKHTHAFIAVSLFLFLLMEASHPRCSRTVQSEEVPSDPSTNERENLSVSRLISYIYPLWAKKTRKYNCERFSFNLILKNVQNSK